MTTATVTATAPADPAADRDLLELGRTLLALEPGDLAAYIASLEPADLPVVEGALAAAEADYYARQTGGSVDWRANPATMAHHLTRGKLRLWRYAVYLGRKFREAVDGTSKRQIWNLPARYGKSLWASQWGPAWALDLDPTLHIILTSYGDELAIKNAVAVRDILVAHADVLRVQLRRDRNRQDLFATSEGGGLLASGILGSITGFPADGAVLDDPFKNWQEAHSEARRDLVEDQYRSVIRLRLETEDAWVILCHTRWHEDDLTGRFIKRMEDGTGEAWEVVRMPAIAETQDPTSLDFLSRLPDPLGRAPGEVLEPERFSLGAVKERHLSIGSYFTAAMEQQRPAPEEGGELRRSWWKWYTAVPPHFDDALSSWDMKLKDKESGDFVVGQVWGRTGSDFWGIDSLRGQWDQATVCNAIALLAVRYPWVKKHVVENTGNGPEVIATLRQSFPGYEVSDEMASRLGMTVPERGAVAALRQRGMPGLLPHNPKGPKAVRARAVAPYAEAGNCHLPEGALWADRFVDEAAAFPNGAHDDQVDAWSQAMGRLARSDATVSVIQENLPKTPITRSSAGSLRSTDLPRTGRYR